jgi:hypothetical protein
MIGAASADTSSVQTAKSEVNCMGYWEKMTEWGKTAAEENE